MKIQVTSCVALLCVLGASGCYLPIFKTDTHAERVPTRDTAQERIERGGRLQPGEGPYNGPQTDPAAQPVEALAHEIAAHTPRPTSIGCLPLVSQDMVKSGPWVSDLGVEIADHCAKALADAGFGANALGTADMGMRVSQANASRASLSTLENVASYGTRLGVDAIVFGTIRRRDHTAQLDRSVLTIEMQAWDVAARKIVARQSFEVASDRPEFRRTFDLAQAESAWSPDNAWQTPGAKPTLANELRHSLEALATRVTHQFDLANVQGAVYVAPLDTSRFVASLAKLRAAQSAYASEYARRTAPNAPAEDGPLVLDGTQFPNLQAAEAWLAQQSEALQTTDAARFGQSVGSLLAEELVPRLAPHNVRAIDVGFTKASDRALVDGELASGGLVRSLAAREALKSAGVGVVVASRLDQVGDTYLLRVESYDLGAASVSSTESVELPASMTAELRRALGTSGL